MDISNLRCSKIVVLVLLVAHTLAFYVVYFQEKNHVLRQTDQEIVCDLSKSQNNPQTIDTRRLVNSIMTEYREDIRSRFQDLVSRKVSSRDSELIALVREMMDPPSDHMIKTSRQIVETPQSKEVMVIYPEKKNGFFIEAGALDGERSSNTIYLEQREGWTGLLVEADPFFYTQLRGKNRHSWSINACIGAGDYPTEMAFKESSGGRGQLKMDESRADRKVPCFPLETLLLAINTTRVDYFSLDVEGFELDILESIPFERLDIHMFSVEYVHGKAGKEAYKSFMENKGYRVHKDIAYSEPKISMYVDDYIFVKNS